MNTDPTPSNTRYRVIAAVITTLTLTAMFLTTSPAPAPKTLNDIDLKLNLPVATEQMFDDMPDSYFKANTLIVMGAHLAGDDEELNKILTEYAEFKIGQENAKR